MIGQRRWSPPVAVLVAALVVALAACRGTGEPGEQAAVPTSDAVDTHEAPDEEARRALVAFGDGLLDETGATGGIVAVRRAGADPVVVAVGTEAGADGSGGGAMDPSSPLHVASVTKSYVAALALLLEADGVIQLDRPIATWLAWPGGEEISLRHLLTHTSGVGRFGDGETPSTYPGLVGAGRPVTTSEALDAARSVPPLGAPGDGTRYGNLNYLLAGAVLEAAAGEPLHDLLRSRLFAPLGLDHTWYPPDGPTVGSPPVGLFEVDPDLDPIATSDVTLDGWQTATGGASGAIATVDDLLAWSDVVFRRQQVGGVDLGAMTEIGAGGYGLGVIGLGPEGDCVFDGCPPEVVFERWALNGDFPGASVRVLHDPADDATLVVFLNRNALDLDASLAAFLDGR